MKLLSRKDDLLNGVNIVLKTVPSRTIMSILECILVNTTDNQIKLTVNDMELGIKTTVGRTIETRGEIALGTKLLSKIIRKLSSGDSPIVIKSDEKSSATITCENSVFHIQGEDEDEFSYLPYIERKNYISLSQFTLKEVIRQTVFFISVNGSNKMMTGELFEMKGNKLKVVSLDGHRISIRKIILKDSYQDIEAIIPGETLGGISKILGGDNEKEVLIFFSRNHILFEFDNTVMVSRLIEGEYFRINQMLSSDYKTKVTINKRGFLDCIDRANILIWEDDKKPIVINILGYVMELKLNSSFGSINAEVLVHKSGEDIMVGFSPKFLVDTLRIIDSEEIDLYMMNPGSPRFIKDAEGQYIHLILPTSSDMATV